MTATLQYPFPSLSGNDSLGEGAAGEVAIISERVVLKWPYSFHNPQPGHADLMRDSRKSIEREKKTYQILAEHPHPHIVTLIRSVPQGIFLHRQQTTLSSRLARPPMSAGLTVRWVRQLVSALSWLEELGLVHGDLRPGNIFLSRQDDIVLGDFDSSVKLGERILRGGAVFCKPDASLSAPVSSAITEQYALGSCIYTIRFRREPWQGLDNFEKTQRLVRSEFPDINEDGVFAPIIEKCWQGKYGSIREVEQDISAAAAGYPYRRQDKVDEQEIMDAHRECDEFMERERLLIERRNALMNATARGREKMAV